MDSRLQIRLSKEEYTKIAGKLNDSGIKFRFCNKHQRYEKNFRSTSSLEACNNQITQFKI